MTVESAGRPGRSDVWAVVLAAGRGSRYGGEVPKQYEPVGGRRVLDWSLDVARRVAAGVVLVVPAELVDRPEPGADRVVAGGETRAASVRAGLAAVPDAVAIVVVHDGARPAASAALWAAVVAAVDDGADGAVPGLPVTDTIKQVGPDGEVVRTVDREGLVAVQTPQAFRADRLRAAHATGGEATDDAALVERAGGRVVVVPGEATNRKVTLPGDLTAVGLTLADRE